MKTVKKQDHVLLFTLNKSNQEKVLESSDENGHLLVKITKISPTLQAWYL